MKATFNYKTVKKKKKKHKLWASLKVSKKVWKLILQKLQTSICKDAQKRLFDKLFHPKRFRTNVWDSLQLIKLKITICKDP